MPQDLNITNAFAQALRQLRNEHNLSQRELAMKLQVKPAQISAFEQGKRLPAKELIAEIATALQADASEINSLWIAFLSSTEERAKLLKEKEQAKLKEQQQKHSSEPLPVASGLVAKMEGKMLPQWFHGCALDVLREVEDGSVDCVLTSPPYLNMRKFKVDTCRARNVNEYVQQLLAVTAELKRVLKPNGSLWINLGDSYKHNTLRGLPWRVAIQMVDKQGWLLRNDVVWDKGQSAFDGTVNQLRCTHEHLFHFVKSENYYFNGQALRQCYNSIPGIDRRAKSTISGTRYARRIAASTALTNEEKANAIEALNRSLEMLREGTIPNFRMTLRHEEGDVEPKSKSKKARDLAKKGFYILKYNPQGMMPPDVWNIAPADSRLKHYNVMPEELCELILTASCPKGGIVLDPYCGTGTVGKVAYDLNQRAMGIDINAELIEMAKRRIRPRQYSLF